MLLIQKRDNRYHRGENHNKGRECTESVQEIRKKTNINKNS